MQNLHILASSQRLMSLKGNLLLYGLVIWPLTLPLNGITLTVHRLDSRLLTIVSVSGLAPLLAAVHLFPQAAFPQSTSSSSSVRLLV